MSLSFFSPALPQNIVWPDSVTYAAFDVASIASSSGKYLKVESNVLTFGNLKRTISQKNI